MLRILSSTAIILLLSTSSFAGNLGITLEDLLTKLQASAKADGISVEISKVNCAENPMPGDDTKKIMSCSHSLGEGKLIITNAMISGELLDISTQRWPEAQADKVIGWIASAINDGDASANKAEASQLVADAKKNNIGNGVMGKGDFIAMKMGDAYVISVSTP